MKDVESGQDELRAGIPNEKILPSLHVFTFRKNQCFNNNPILRKVEATSDIVKAEKELLSETRDKIIAVLKLILGGDALASEFVFLNLLARVHTRKDSFTIGNISLNLTNLNFFQGRNLAKFISAIIPFSLHIPVSIDTLENKRFSPLKNYDTNVLESGVLQMIDGTFVVCDETTMKEGVLKVNGVAGIKAIATLIE